jgi:hypothetical protein
MLSPFRHKVHDEILKPATTSKLPAFYIIHFFRIYSPSWQNRERFGNIQKQ